MASLQKALIISVILCCVFSDVLCKDLDLFADSQIEGNRAHYILRVGEKSLKYYLFLEGRTFGHHFLKRISFAIIPAAFVVGVITTLLGALTIVSIKGLGVGVRKKY